MTLYNIYKVATYYAKGDATFVILKTTKKINRRN